MVGNLKRAKTEPWEQAGAAKRFFFCLFYEGHPRMDSLYRCSRPCDHYYYYCYESESDPRLSGCLDLNLLRYLRLLVHRSSPRASYVCGSYLTVAAKNSTRLLHTKRRAWMESCIMHHASKLPIPSLLGDATGSS